MKCHDLQRNVLQAWGFLFSEYNFQILSCQEAERESAVLFVESPQCRMRFMSVNFEDELTIDLGSHTAALDWSPNDDLIPRNNPNWFSILGLLVYLERNPETLLANMGKVKDKKMELPQSATFLERMAYEARPHLPKIFGWFSQSQYERFRFDYEIYQSGYGQL